MANEVTTFMFEASEVRTVLRDGEPWFVARDVATLLGYAVPRKAVFDHCKGCSEMELPSSGGLQRTSIIPERDVYRLIMRSKLPAAEQFEEWVVGTVLPSLRKHGGYVVGQETMTRDVLTAIRGVCLTLRFEIGPRPGKVIRGQAPEMLQTPPTPHSRQPPGQAVERRFATVALLLGSSARP